MFGSVILLQGPEPVVDVLADLVLGKAVALLQLAFELFAAALDDVEIVIGELAPLLLGGTLELLPVALRPCSNPSLSPPVLGCSTTDGGLRRS
jgi:hypothetical protein